MNESLFLQGMAGKTPEQKTDAILDAMIPMLQSLPKKNRKTASKRLNSALGSPGDATRDRIWLIIVWAFVLVLGGSAIVLGAAVFWETKANTTYFAKIETIVTVFTSVLAFLSGLLAPSPIKAGGDDD